MKDKCRPLRLLVASPSGPHRPPAVVTAAGDQVLLLVALISVKT